METPPENNEVPDSITSLDDHIIRYDFKKMMEEALSEFDAAMSSRELIDQDSIARIFKLENADDERN